MLTEVPTCTNCHSFSADGRTMGMDLDGPDGDKGTYVIAPVEPRMLVEDEDVITWNSFPGKPPDHKTIGFLSRVSPDGQHVVSTVNESLVRVQFQGLQVPAGLLSDTRYPRLLFRATGEMKAVPGADDPRYVHCDAVWTPDGKSLVFARAEAKDPYPEGGAIAQYADDPAEIPIQYDLYRLPFSDGLGGQPEPIAGASQNGISNTFPKISPDGKWIVFVKCKNGQLMRPDGRLCIIPVEGGTAREMGCNTRLMNSWHSFSPNSRWMVFSSKANTPYTQMFLTHIDEQGQDSPAILIPNSTAANRAVNLPEFVNIQYDDLVNIDMPALDYRRHGLLGMLLAEKGLFAEALAEFDQAVQDQPDYHDGRMNAAILLLRQGKVDEAKSRLEELLELDPKYLRARRELAALLEKQGLTAEAILQYETGLSHNREFVEAHVKLAQIYLDRGELEKATEHLRTLLDLDSKNPLRFLDLALVLLKRGLLEDAGKYLEESLALDPDFAAGHFYLGEVRMSQGEYASAIDQFQHAARVDAISLAGGQRVGLAAGRLSAT